MAENCDRCGRPILFPLSERYGTKRHVVAARVRHAYYGCDTGCCGHEIVGVDCGGKEVWNEFQFEHPYGEKDTKTWAEKFAATELPGIPLDWENSSVTDNC